MTYVGETENMALKKEKGYASLIFWCIIFFVLLLVRDAYEVGINKYILLGAAVFCAVFMKTDKLIYFYCFLFPLYVGLPGNYLTLVFLARLIMNVEKGGIKLSSLFFAIVICELVFWQNITYGTDEILNMMFLPGVLVILMLYSYNKKLDTGKVVMFYSAGVAALGLIMLLATLDAHEFSDLLTTSFRLGTSAATYTDTESMNVSIDPNFYGCFVIAAISTAVPLALKTETKKYEKLLLLGFSVTSTLICFVGLSRAFLLVLVVWAVCYLVSQNNIKGAIAMVSIAVLVIVLVVYLIPDAFDSIMARFKMEDMATANGRTTGMKNYFNLWKENPGFIIFGLGIFRCFVHCMPLQAFFGGGIIFFIFSIAYIKSFCIKGGEKLKFVSLLPIIVTFIMSCTIPSIHQLCCLFPLIYCGLLLRYEKMETIKGADSDNSQND